MLVVGSKKCEQCDALATRVYWQSGGALGQGSELVAAHLGYTLHLCATHDTGVNPGVWTLIGQAPIPATRTTWRRPARGLPRAR